MPGLVLTHKMGKYSKMAKFEQMLQIGNKFATTDIPWTTRDKFAVKKNPKKKILISKMFIHLSDT